MRFATLLIVYLTLAIAAVACITGLVNTIQDGLAGKREFALRSYDK